MALASAHPQQCCFRIATGRRLHQLFQRSQEARLSLGLWPAAAARTANPAFQTCISGPQFRKTAPDRTARNACRRRNCRHSTSACRASLGRRQKTPCALIKIRRKRLEASLDRDDINHSGRSKSSNQ
jgi:hypothetical protein